MKIACVKAIADLAMAESSEIVAAAYAGEELKFGPEYLIPKPFDPRLIIEVAPAIAKAAMDSGVATKAIEDFDAYRETLHEFVFKSGQLMRPIFYRASQDPKRVVYAEGESKRVLRAVQSLVDQNMVRPILIGRPDVVQMRVDGLGLRLKQGIDYEICDPQDDPRYGDYWRQYHSLMERKGVSPDAARTIIRTNTTAIAAIMLKRGEADAMICGTYGQYDWHLRYVMDIIDRREGVTNVSALSVLLLSKGTYFFCDTHVTPDPSAEQLAEMTILAADEIRRFGITPKVGLLSHSNFGSHRSERAVKMSEAVKIIRERAPDLEVEGEMQGDVALNEEIRDRVFPNSQLEGRANLLIMPTLGAANISFNLVKSLGEGLSVGPLLIGTAQPAHIVTPAISARGIVNISALAVVDAQSSENEQRELL